MQQLPTLAGPLADAVRSLKEEPGADIVVTGSITLAHNLIAADLVDEYRLFVYSAVIGSGAAYSRTPQTSHRTR